MSENKLKQALKKIRKATLDERLTDSEALAIINSTADEVLKPEFKAVEGVIYMCREYEGSDEVVDVFAEYVPTNNYKFVCESGMLYTHCRKFPTSRS